MQPSYLSDKHFKKLLEAHGTKTFQKCWKPMVQNSFKKIAEIPSHKIHIYGKKYSSKPNSMQKNCTFLWQELQSLQPLPFVSNHGSAERCWRWRTGFIHLRIGTAFIWNKLVGQKIEKKAKKNLLNVPSSLVNVDKIVSVYEFTDPLRFRGVVLKCSF